MTVAQAKPCARGGKPKIRHNQVHRADKAAQTQRHINLGRDNYKQADQSAPPPQARLLPCFPLKKYEQTL